jgi:hypothetical protein
MKQTLPGRKSLPQVEEVALLGSHSVDQQREPMVDTTACQARCGGGVLPKVFQTWTSYTQPILQTP